MAFLIVERGVEEGRRYALTSFPVSLGRDAHNEVVLKDTEVSRFHCRIKKRGRLYILEDLESRNGSYVNGDRVVNATINNGDKIMLGATELKFLATTTEIQIASELANFDMIIAEDLGLDGPIDLDTEHKSAKFKPTRLNPQLLANNVAKDQVLAKVVFDHQGNLMVKDELSEAAKTLLKSLGQILGNASRAVFFSWSSQSQQLTPWAARTYTEKKAFSLSQRAFEDLVTRRQVILMSGNAKAGNPGRNIAVLPMQQGSELIGLIHVECDDQRHAFRNIDLEISQALINRSAAIFESMQLRRELDSWILGVLETMIATVEAKDTYTRGHSERVSRYCMAIADELTLSREVKRLLMISSLCHDIGKIGVPDIILKKASILSAEEYLEMKLHPSIGAEIISHMPNAQRFVSGIKYHHEKWDGTGYPEGLAGEEIPFFGRIVAIADVFDAMVSGRAYSGFMDQDEAVAKLQSESELFDPEILRAFTRANEKGTLTTKTSTQNNELPTEVVGAEPPSTAPISPSIRRKPKA